MGSEAQYSFQHVKAFAVHNGLFSDPWHLQSTYFIDKHWHVWKLHIPLHHVPLPPVKVFEIPDANEQQQRTDRLNLSLTFASATYAVIADGCGQIILLETPDRTSENTWKVNFKGTVLGENSCYNVLSCFYETSDAGVPAVHCLLLSVVEDGTEANKSAFTTHLDWVTLSPDENGDWGVVRHRTVQCKEGFEYAAIYEKSLLIASPKAPAFTYDSAGLTEHTEPDTEAAGGDADKPAAGTYAYVWHQTVEEVTVTFNVGVNITRSEVCLKLKRDYMDLGLTTGQILLKGELCGCVDTDSSTWTLSDGRLELVLFKTSGEKWPLVVAGDTRGEMVLDEAAAQAIHAQLEHLTSSTWNASPEVDKPAYNCQELEACDVGLDQQVCVYHMNGDSHKCENTIDIGGQQVLFSTSLVPDKPPSLCLRHDVDAVLWSPDREAGATPWQHTSTFNNLGYVAASKQERKYSACSPNFSFSVLIDCKRHAYVYHRPSAIANPVRNRRTGQTIGEIAKMNVISLESSDDIQGYHVTNSQLVLLQGSTIHIIKVIPEQEI